MPVAPRGEMLPRGVPGRDEVAGAVLSFNVGVGIVGVAEPRTLIVRVAVFGGGGVAFPFEDPIEVGGTVVTGRIGREAGGGTSPLV